MTLSSLKKANKAIWVIAIIGLALIVLTNCGIGHGHYRYGSDGRNYSNNYSGYHRSDYGGHNQYPAASKYARGRGDYCGW